jgi:hypothetical protein
MKVPTDLRQKGPQPIELRILSREICLKVLAKAPFTHDPKRTFASLSLQALCIRGACLLIRNNRRMVLGYYSDWHSCRLYSHNTTDGLTPRRSGQCNPLLTTARNFWSRCHACTINAETAT